MKKVISGDQRGLAHVALVLIVVIVLGAVGYAGYRVLNKDKGQASVATSEEAKELKAACDKEIDDEDFCKFVTSWTDMGEYTAVMETSGANGSSKITLKDDGGDNSYMLTESGGATVAEYITIGNSTYVKDLTDSAWVKYTSEDYQTTDLQEDLDFDFEESVPEAERTKYTKVGKEDCGNLTCFKYQIVDPANPNDEQFIWFDDEDYLLRRWQITGGEGTTNATFSYDSVEISEPSPIKEAPSLSDGPSEEELQALMEAYQNSVQ